MFRAVAGSCATYTCEPSQGRKAAALSGSRACAAANLAAAQSTGRLRRVPASHPRESRSADPVRADTHVDEQAPGGEATTPYQSLYRRFRPRRFSEVLGQEHVSQGLSTAVREGRVGHAYLFSGPRGTGKTSAARILAMALNCENPVEGEPCGVCTSCVEIARGSSLDVHELDAASNNKIEPMRELVSRAALGTPGRWKVYIVDEVHMLTPGASNALLKTLEEPPSHVVFVLATTDPQKVLETVRSRTQHFEFRLLDPETLEGLLTRVAEEAGLELREGVIEAAVRRGRGSARDALSALDQMATGGIVEDEVRVISDLADALAERDTHRALVAVEQAVISGRDPQRLSSELVEELRQGFLAAVAPDLMSVAGDDRERITSRTREMGLPALVRAMETIGRAQVDMRDSPDPRVHLEVAIARLTHPEADSDIAALTERIERLERALAGGRSAGSVPPPVTGGSSASSGSSSTSEASASDDQQPEASSGSGHTPATGGDPRTSGSGSSGSGSSGSRAGGEGPNLARKALGAIRAETQPEHRPDAVTESRPEHPPDALTKEPEKAVQEHGARAEAEDSVDLGDSSSIPTRESVVQAWGDTLLKTLPGKTRAYFGAGRWLGVEDGVAIFALPNEPHRSSCEGARQDVESALQAHFGAPLKLRLTVDDESIPVSTRPIPRSNNTVSTASSARESSAVGNARTPVSTSSPASAPPFVAAQPPPPFTPDLLDPHVLAAETELAGAGPSVAERLKLAFPGAEEV